MYRAKTLLAGLAAAGLLLGVATTALGHGVQGQDRIPSGGHGTGRGHGMPSGHGMSHGHGMHHDMKMGPGAGQGKGLGPRMLYGWPSGETQDLSVEGARGWLERKLDWHGNPRLKLGEVVAADDDTITAEIVTRDGSLV